jgi:hypothetical protein
MQSCARKEMARSSYAKERSIHGLYRNIAGRGQRLAQN